MSVINSVGPHGHENNGDCFTYRCNNSRHETKKNTTLPWHIYGTKDNSHEIHLPGHTRRPREPKVKLMVPVFRPREDEDQLDSKIEVGRR